MCIRRQLCVLHRFDRRYNLAACLTYMSTDPSAHNMGSIPQCSIDGVAVSLAHFPCGSQLDALQQPAATGVLRHRFRCRAHVYPYGAYAESSDLEPVGRIRSGIESAKSAIDTFFGDVVVPAIHPGARDPGIHHRSAGQPEHDVGGCEQCLLERFCGFRPRHGAVDPGLVVGVAIHATPCAPGSEAWRVHGQTVRSGDPVLGSDQPAHRKGHLASLLAQRDDAEFGRVRFAGKEQLRRLPAANRRPGRNADGRYAVLYSFADGGDGGRYYDAHSLSNMRHELTILAYEMNGASVSVLHGAPLRLRCENEVGFKMVKWIAAIELVHDYADLGAGEGGYNEDHEFYGYRVPI